jgi:hypothetical protein
MEPKHVYVNLLRSPGIDSQPGGTVRQPYFSYWQARGRIINVYGAQESIPRNEFRQHSLAGRYDNPIPTRFLALKECLKIPAQAT